MAEMMSYAEPLRAIGQALERLNVERFEMEPDGEEFIVRGNVTVGNGSRANKPLEPSTMGHIWKLLARSKREVAKTLVGEKTPIVTELDLRYTRRDIDRLEQEGRAKRGEAQGMADATSLPQLLRTIGAYVNHKGARLLKISRRQESLTLTYQTAAGQKIEEVLAPSDLYDFWVRMYLKRTVRAGH